MKIIVLFLSLAFSCFALANLTEDHSQTAIVDLYNLSVEDLPPLEEMVGIVPDIEKENLERGEEIQLAHGDEDRECRRRHGHQGLWLQLQSQRYYSSGSCTCTCSGARTGSTELYLQKWWILLLPALYSSPWIILSMLFLWNTDIQWQYQFMVRSKPQTLHKTAMAQCIK